MSASLIVTNSPKTVNSFNPGDFIKSAYAGWCCGLVIDRGTVCKGRIEGYVVELASGKRDFIPADDAVLICPSEETLMARYAGQAA